MNLKTSDDIKKEIKEETKKYNVLIGKSAKKYRTETGLTQEYVAEKVGITPEYLSKFENGHYNASIYNIIKLCQTFDITPNELLQDFFKESSHGISQLIYTEANKLSLKNQEAVLALIKSLDNDQKE